MSKKAEQINIKVTPAMKFEIETVAFYEGASVTELIRGWIRARISEYRRNKRFAALMAKRKKELFEKTEEA